MTTASRKLFVLPPVEGVPADWIAHEDIARAGDEKVYVTFRLQAQKAILQSGMSCRLVTPSGEILHAKEAPAETMRAVSAYWFMLGHGHHFHERELPEQGEYRVTWTRPSGEIMKDYRKTLTW